MIKVNEFKYMTDLNSFIVNNNITRSQIISIESFYDRANTTWGVELYKLYYFVSSIPGDDK